MPHYLPYPEDELPNPDKESKVAWSQKTFEERVDIQIRTLKREINDFLGQMDNVYHKGRIDQMQLTISQLNALLD